MKQSIFCNTKCCDTSEKFCECGDCSACFTSPSYHDSIQKVAREVEVERRKIYSTNSNEIIKWAETEYDYIYAILYKILRVKVQTKDRKKALDDILDAYNYCALLYESVSK